MYEPPSPAQLAGRAKLQELITKAIGSDKGGQQRLADITGIPSPTLGQYRMGRRLPSSIYEPGLAKGLGIPVQELHELIWPASPDAVPNEPEPEELQLMENMARTFLQLITDIRARRKPTRLRRSSQPKRGNQVVDQLTDEVDIIALITSNQMPTAIRQQHPLIQQLYQIATAYQQIDLVVLAM